MGRKNQKKAMRMEDTDDDSMSTSSTVTSSDITTVQEVEEERDESSVLEGYIDSLYEKRSKTREDGLKGLASALKNNVLGDFVDNKYETLVHLCINSIKKGSATEITFASQVIGLVAVTSGAGDISQHALSESSPYLTKAAKLGSDSKARIAALEALALACFVGAVTYEVTEEVMAVLWQIGKHKGNQHSDQTLGMNKPSAEVRAAALLAWAFLLTVIPTSRVINHHLSEQCLSMLLSLLESEDQAVRISAGEAIAVLFETRNLQDLEYTNAAPKEDEILEQVRLLAAEAGGKGQSSKKVQRSSFKEILSILEGGPVSTMSVKVQQGDTLNLQTWSQMIQYKFLTHTLAEGLQRHLQENTLLHEVFSFIPRQEKPKTLTSKEKRMYMSPNSVLSKARTQSLNRRRNQAHAGQIGHFSVSEIDSD